MTGFNVGCIDDIDSLESKEVSLIDGKKSSVR